MVDSGCAAGSSVSDDKVVNDDAGESACATGSVEGFRSDVTGDFLLLFLFCFDLLFEAVATLSTVDSFFILLELGPFVTDAERFLLLAGWRTPVLGPATGSREWVGIA